MSSHSSRVTHARAQHVQGDTDGTEVVGIYAAAAAQGRVSPAGAQQGSNGSPGIPGCPLAFPAGPLVYDVPWCPKIFTFNFH